MLDFNETMSNPAYENPPTEAEQEQTGPTPGRDEPASEPNEETGNNQPHHAEADATPADGQRRRIDLRELFTFDGGYANPPRGSWYRPGTSGNPGGRPKGSKNKPKKLTDKNFNEILRSVLNKEVRLKDGETVSTARAVTQRLADQALAGNVRAIQLMINCHRAADAADAAQQEAEYSYAVAYMTRWGNSELDGQKPVPHPDHIILDHLNKKAMFTGPRNEEELKKILAGVDIRQEADEEEEEMEEEVEERSFRMSKQH